MNTDVARGQVLKNDAKESLPAQNDSPLGGFEQLIRDSWIVTASTGRKMRHAWRWGPGRYSIERWTDGESAMGDPWRELIVYYWHPQEKRVNLLGVSPFQSGVSRGSIDFDGNNATADIRLSQARDVRQMQTQWRFSDADHYRETLLEKDANGKLFELVAFEHLREPDAKTRRNDADSVNSEDALSSELENLRFLLGKNWKCRIGGEPERQLTTAIEWIPNAKFIYGRAWLAEAKHSATNQPSANEQESEPSLNFYIYHDVESQKVQCLVLTKDANVYAGEVAPSKEEHLQVELHSRGPNATARIHMTIEAVADRQMLQQLQFNEDGRSLRLEHAR